MDDWKKAEHDFKNSYNRYGKRAVVVRFSDTAEAKALNGKKAFAKAQASDFLVVCEGLTFFAEVKSCGERVSFPHGNIQPKQLAKARQITMAGGTYLFFIQSRHHNKWFRVPAQVILKSEKKSTRWADIADLEWDPYEPLP